MTAWHVTLGALIVGCIDIDGKDKRNGRLSRIVYRNRMSKSWLIVHKYDVIRIGINCNGGGLSFPLILVTTAMTDVGFTSG